MKTAFLFALLWLASLQLSAQSQEAQQLLINVEKLSQFKQILSDMKKGYQMLSSGYNTVKDLSQGNFSLHKTFLDGLMQVSPEVRKYKRTAEIISGQIRIMNACKNSQQRFARSGSFSIDELRYTAMVYQRILDQSLQNLEDLAMVMTGGKLRMDDSERIAEIDEIYLDQQEKLQFVQHFNHQGAQLFLLRSKAKKDLSDVRKLYPLTAKP